MKKYTFIIILTVLYSCNTVIKPSSKLKVIDEIKLNIQEPSGITYYKNHLYIVSDFNGIIYKTTLKGKIVNKIPTNFTDLEGITINNKGELYIVDENKRSLIKIKSNGKIDKKHKIKGEQKKNNSGLEGVCFNPVEGNFFILNEKFPKQLLTVSKKGKITTKAKLPFAKDVSGICFDEKSNSLWLVSDESQKIYQVSFKGKKQADYKIPINKAEGITIVDNKFYIVSDLDNKLFVLK